MPAGIYKHHPHQGFQKETKIRNTGRTHFKKGIRNNPKGEFKKGHIPWFKLYPKLAPKGKDNGKWKGGQAKDKNGYVLILKPNHPFAINKRYILEHRLVVEAQIGRYLLPKEVVHHINHIRNDNRPENLMLFVNNTAHKKFHSIQEGIQKGEIIFDGHRLHHSD